VTFANAGALMWLIPLGGAIILLYLLKMRRKDLRVPATFLWPAMTYEVRANSLFQRLRFSWLMVLQLLAILLIILGMARPQVRQQGLGGEVTVIVLDTSASMSATDVAPSRFDEGVRAALAIINSARVGDRVSVIESGPSTRVVFPLSSDPAKMRRTLQGVEVTHGEGDVAEALRLAASIADRQPSARIVLISDGVFPEVRNFSAGQAKVAFHKVGASGENTSISALGLADVAGGRELYCGLRNHGLKPSSGALNLYADGKLFDALKVTVPAGQSIGHTARAPKGASVFEAKLDLNDALPADNYAVSLNDPGATVRTLLVSEGNLFLERALSLDPRVTLDRSTSVPSSADYDLVVFDGLPEQPVRARAVLTFGAAGASSPVRKVGNLSRPQIDTLDRDHPIMRAVELDGVYIESAENVVAKGSGEVLAGAAGKPMIVASQTDKRRVYVAFQPLKSDFPLQVAFPIFLSNTLDYLVPRERGRTALSVNAGRTFSLPALDERHALRLERAGGQAAEVAAAGGVYSIRDVRQVGVYELQIGDQRQKVYSSLSSEIESNIAPQERVLLGGATVQAAGSVLRLADFWRPLLLLALLVLAGEWWLFSRRS
jgi:Ca-activated chloride channel homolog